MAPKSPEEIHYLLGIFPSELLTRLPNVRTWAIEGTDHGDASDPRKTVSKPRALSFHKTIMIQLRYTMIEELHLSHILFSSDAELIRLVGSMRHLRHLKYAHIRAQKHVCLLSQKAATRMALRSLSSLDIHVQDTEDAAADVLIILAQRTLRNLTIRLRPQARWGLGRSTARNPAQLNLDFLTFHVEPDGDIPLDSLPVFVLEMCQHATSQISALHPASTVKELAIHVSSESSASIPSGSLALRLTKSESFLERFRSLHLDLAGQVPSKVQLHIHLSPRGGPRGVVVQGTVLASDNFVFEESYRRQVQYYSEGNIWRSATEGELDSVIALKISPDRKWVASGSPQQAILWNAAMRPDPEEGEQSPEMVYEWIAPMDDDLFTRPFAFSPDSRLLACCTRDPESFVQVRDVFTGNRVAALRVPTDAMDGLDTCRASCVWSSNGKTLTSVVFIPSQHQFLAQVWDAENYRSISTTAQTTSCHSPSFLYSPDGRWLASFQTARGLSGSQTTLPTPMFSTPNTGACTVLGAPLTGVPTVVAGCHILSATFDHASTRFAAVSSDHVLHVWSLSTGTKLLRVPMNEYPNDPDRLVLAFSPGDGDGAQLLSCSSGRGAAFVLTARDAASGRTLLPRRSGYHFLRGRTAPRFVFSDDGRFLLSASEDGLVQLWRAGDASFVGDVVRDGDVPTTFAWGEDGRVLAWGTEGGGVVVKPL